MTYLEAFSIALLVGLLGGISSHAVWLIRILRKLLERDRTLSVSRKMVRSRLALFAFTAALGGIGGSIAGTIAYNRSLGVSALVALAFAGGFAIDTVISRGSRLDAG